MQSIIDILTLSTQYLKEKGVANSRRQAEDLLCDVLKMDRLKLYLDFERPLNQEELTLCRERLSRRARGEPLQYIKGQVEFYDCLIHVNPDVLIPRQETEILVDKIVQYLNQQELKGKVLWDVCCGSGCIGIAIKKRFPELKVVLSDISKEALQIAALNAKQNEVAVELIEGDLLQPFKAKKANYVICNPPYVTESEYITLDREVRCYEPRLALVGGATGLEFYKRLADELPACLYPSAATWLEMGYQQGEAIKALFQGKEWKKSHVEKDWSGHDRFFFLENE